MIRPRFSTLFALGFALIAALLGFATVVLDVTARPPTGKTVVTVRLWDEQVAAAYRKSFAEFTRTHPDIDVRTNVVSYSTYFTTLRTDVAGGSADDIFWVSNAYLAGYADSGRLIDIGKTLGPRAGSAWEPSVVQQFTRGETLWAVPQLTDAGIAVYYNADLLAAAGVDTADLSTLRWSPNADDTLRPLLRRLTVDADGHTAGATGFDPSRIRQWGYNAANDAQGIYLNYIGSAGGAYQTGDRFTFDNPGAVEAFTYLVKLINDDHVAPPASETNDNGDFSRNQFLAGRMALFQSGTYNLATITAQANFRWGVAMLPAGPKGRVSVTNGIAAAGNSASRASGRGTPGIGLAGQHRGKSVHRPPRQRYPCRHRGPAGVLRLLADQGRRRQAILRGPQRTADRRSRRGRLRCRKSSSQIVFRRDVLGPQRCRNNAA